MKEDSRFDVATHMATETQLRILIVDDQSLVRSAVRMLLESHSGWRVVGEASDGLEAIDKTRELQPDVVVMDLSMPNMGGLEATREIRACFPETRILILTLHYFPQLARTVQRAGAQGCVLKSDSGRYLIPAVSSLSKSQPFFVA
jgi:DNA-binding NarL/FixJ family response regulator